MTAPQWDIVIIGAGIHGAGLAQAAAAAGYQTLLLEQYAEPAQGTSSKSSKLIHGGLRYLESGEFALVKECLHERKLLLKNAPHLVKMNTFHIPVYRDTSRSAWTIRLGLGLYSLFSWQRFHQLPRSKWGLLDGLNQQNLQTVFSYYDAQTDDALLTRAVLASAQSLGASLRYRTRVVSAAPTDDGMRLHCDDGGQKLEVTARLVFNASGPWVADVHRRLLQHGDSTSNFDVSLVQGAHIVLPTAVKHAYYLEAPQDKRAVFVLPWREQTLVGTTETEFSGDPAEVAPRQEEIDYLLAVYRHYFSARQQQVFQREDVVNSFAGLRVLPAGDGAAFGKSRDTIFVADNERAPRVVSILGGKLTAYRATAEKLVERVRHYLPKRQPQADTRELRLPRPE